MLQMARGIHTLPNDGITTDWLTPPELLDRLGVFELDPCAHPSQPWTTAGRMIAPPDDGLTGDWGRARVWLNPPYGRSITPWMERMAAHNHGTALVPARTEVERWFFPFVWESAAAVLFLRGRLFFLTPAGGGGGKAAHGSVLVAYGVDDARKLKRSGLPGQFVKLPARKKG
jgi:hypothetical protein